MFNIIFLFLSAVSLSAKGKLLRSKPFLNQCVSNVFLFCQNIILYLCRGLYRFFSYAGDRLLALARLQRQTGSAAKAAFLARREEKRRWEGVSRNDPCPCGSGKKAKKCCWDSRP